jgi:hypothetical protein
MKTEYVFLAPEKIFDLTYQLGEKIKKSGFVPDCLVGISRGGLWVVRTLSDFFDIKDVHITRVIYYEDVKTTKTKPNLIQDVDKKFLKNKKLLIVDDVSDTGNSLDFTVNLIKEKGIKNFKTATLHYKPWSIFKPDYFIEETDKWIIYPWEIGETIRSIMKKNMTEEEKIRELRMTGMPPEKIKKYVNNFQ